MSDSARRVDDAKICAEMIYSAFHRSGTTQKQVADALGCSQQFVQMLTSASGGSKTLSYRHVLLLARGASTREFARLLMAPILETADSHQLRVVDLEHAAKSTLFAEATRDTLRGIIERLGMTSVTTVKSYAVEGELSATVSATAANGNAVEARMQVKTARRKVSRAKA